MARVSRHPRVAKKQANVVRAIRRTAAQEDRAAFWEAFADGLGLVLSSITFGMLIAKLAIDYDNRKAEERRSGR